MSKVVCLLNVEADRATFTWSEGPASFEPYTLDGMVYKDFKEVADEARDKLADLVKDYLFDEQAMGKSAFALADAGHELYQAMFDPGADQARQARQVRKWLEELAGQREVDTLEIVFESPWSLPWNIVYDQKPDKEAFLSGDDNPDRWKPFWGLRYNLAGGRKVDPLRRMPLLNDPKVLMVVDPEIRDGLPEEQQQRLAEFAAAHTIAIVHSKDTLQDAISAERPDLLYWLSHAEPDALMLAGEPISPRNMRKLLRPDDEEHFGGLAFLNACQTAEGGATGSFFEAFHSVGFAGMIGTEHQTVDQFANPLGLDFLEAFLDRGEPVGSALRKLRGRVPLGLLYGTYCPPDIRVNLGEMQDGLEIRQVHVDGVALGAGRPEEANTAEILPPLPDEPYRSLAYYDRQDRALFAGRDDDIERFATYLDDGSTRILVLHGESGVGKSSFLHAGVIPYLEEECLGYQFIRDRDAETSANDAGAVIFIRATNDLHGQLAQALCEFCAQPYAYQTPLGEQVSADLPSVLGEVIGDNINPGTVRAALRGDPSLLGQIMSAIGNRLPFTAILVIDQGEEVFTLAKTEADRQHGRQALDMLRRTVGVAGNFRVIFSLRTEYYGRVIDRLRRGLHDSGSIREYLLTDFDEHDLLEAIVRPTAAQPIPYTADVPRDKYGFGYDHDVAELIAKRVIHYTTQRRDSVLPLMQVICAQLYRLASQRGDKTITLADLDTMGGIEGGMRNHVEGLLAELLKGRPGDKRPLQELFTQLYLRQPDGTLTTALLAEDEVEQRWTGEMPFDQLLRASQAMRLLKVNTLRIGDEDERRYVSLGHDALAKIAAAWDERLSRAARFRKMAAAIFAVSAIALVMAVLAVRASIAQKRAEVEQRRAEVAQQRAERNFNMARDAVDTYFTEVSTGELENLPGGAVLSSKLLEKARSFYDKFLEENATNPDVHQGVAVANFNLGYLAEQNKDLDEAVEKYKKAIDIQRGLAANIPRNPQLTEKEDQLLDELGNALFAIGFAELLRGKLGDAKLQLSHAHDVQRRLAETTPNNPEHWLRLARTRMVMGHVKWSLDDTTGAREDYKNAQHTRQNQLTEATNALEASHNFSSEPMLGGREQGEATRLQRIQLKAQIGRAQGFFETFADFEAWLKQIQAEAQIGLAEGYVTLAELDDYLGERPGVEDAQQQQHVQAALAAAEKAVIADEWVLQRKPHLRAQSTLAKAYTLLAKFKGREDPAAGLQDLEKARMNLEDLTHWNPDTGRYSNLLAECYREMAHLQRQSKQIELARKSLENGRAVLQKFLDKNDATAARNAKANARDWIDLEMSDPENEQFQSALVSAVRKLEELLETRPPTDKSDSFQMKDEKESRDKLNEAQTVLQKLAAAK